MVKTMLTFLSKGLKSLSLRGTKLVVVQNAKISGRGLRGGPLEFAKPYDYINKRYRLLEAFFDKTSWRFNENSKIIVVEGPIAAGKTAFAKHLAEELDMLHMPETTMDDLYITSYGNDIREYDSQLPVSARSFDSKNFCENPYHQNVGAFQMLMFKLRYAHYVDALAHLMNTGQGVVLERCVYSDYVFLEAMMDAGYIRKEVGSVYNDVKNNVMLFLMKPHLVIYLDVPVPKVQEKIKQRSLSYEVNSKALTPSYLSSLELHYKGYLKEISKHAELLVYDWSEGGDVEVVVEDIERIDFDRFERHDKKLHDWRFGKEWELCEKRIVYTNERDDIVGYFNVPRLDVPELLLEPEDAKRQSDVYATIPGVKYTLGFNHELGDNVLFKHRGPRRFRKVF